MLSKLQVTINFAHNLFTRLLVQTLKAIAVCGDLP